MRGHGLNFLVVLLGVAFRLVSQTQFTKLPSDLQMFPRQADGFGHFSFSGITTNSKLSSIRSVLIEQQSGKVVESIKLRPDSDGRFSCEHKVPAQLMEYQLLIYEIGLYGNDTLIKSVNRLVAGDFYIIAGQSNAEAAYSWNEGPLFDSQYSHFACRSIGTNFVSATSIDTLGRPNIDIENDCYFGYPSSIFGTKQPWAFSGIWGTKLQHDLAISTGIPVCFVNAGRGSSSILDCFPSRIPSVPSLLRHSLAPDGTPPLVYDRTYKKLLEAGALNYVRGIFWYQGETDGALERDSALVYENKFTQLKSAWKLDYPGLEKIIVVQISVGCGGANLRLVAEQQRRFIALNNDVVLMSSTGYELQDKVDYCHFRRAGYTKLADKLFPLVRHCFYMSPSMNINDLPANILSANRLSATHLMLEFDREIMTQPEVVYPDSSTWSMKDNFFGDDDKKLRIDSLYCDNKKLHLLLDPDQKNLSLISYLPANYSDYGVFAGPWLVNKYKPEVGALIFYQVHVQFDSVSTDTLSMPAIDVVENHEYPLHFSTAGQHEVRVYDMAGRLFGQWQIQTEDSAEIPIDLSYLESGFYVIRHYSEKESGAFKLFKL